MNNRRISSREAEELASGRVPKARRDLEPLAAVMEDYRRAATTQSRIQPSAALAARIDLGNTPEIPLEQAPDTGRSTAAIRAGSGLLGIGLAVVIALGAASGAAALVGSAGLLPSDAQSAFDDLVSVIVPTEGAADETTDDNGEAPSDTLPNTGGTDVTEGAAEPTPSPTSTPKSTPTATPSPSPSSPGRDSDDDDDDDDHGSSGSRSDDGKRNGNGNSGNGNSGNGNSGNGNSGNGNSGNGSSGNGNSGSGSSTAGSGNSGNSNSSATTGNGNGNSGNGNSGNGNGNGNSGNGNSGNGNGNSGNGNGNSGNKHSDDHDDDD